MIKEHPEFRVKDYFLSRTIAIYSPIHIPKFERLPRKTFIVSGFIFFITQKPDFSDSCHLTLHAAGVVCLMNGLGY